MENKEEQSECIWLRVKEEKKEGREIEEKAAACTIHLLLKVPPFLPGAGGGEDGRLAMTAIPLKLGRQSLDRRAVPKHHRRRLR